MSWARSRESAARAAQPHFDRVGRVADDFELRGDIPVLERNFDADFRIRLRRR